MKPILKESKIRKCKSCIACCEGWLQTFINGFHVYPGVPCPHSTSNGCSIYIRRPVDPCVNFKCGWLIDESPLPEWMKPNNSKVIVMFNKFNWNNKPVDLAVPVGKNIPAQALQWLKDFSVKQDRPLLYTEQISISGQFQKDQQYYAYGVPEFRETIRLLIQEGKQLG